jgi:hypothetical protein
MYRRQAAELEKRINAAFWDASKGMYADDLSKKYFSEHTQCLAILSGLLEEQACAAIGEKLFCEKNLSQTTIYFTHYLFETCYKLARMDVFFDRLGLWFDLEKLGFKTTFETPEPSRSDCHAWGAHPIYHYFASILGIRPCGPGFQDVMIRPQPGSLSWAKGTLVHPKGKIEVDLKKDKDELTAVINLPKGLTGSLIWRNKKYELAGGRQEIRG